MKVPTLVKAKNQKVSTYKAKEARPTKEARIDIRLTEDRKAFFARAADLAGFKTVSEFIISTVNERSSDILNKSVTYLNHKDYLIVSEAIERPKEPNEALKKAFAKHKKK